MNREILFKAKRKDNGEWIEGNYVYEKYSNKHYITKQLENSHQLIEVIPETICQYTGLKDKNGVKIFEYDIVKCKLIDQVKSKGKWINKESYENYQVIYSQEDLGFRFKDEWMTIWNFKNCELEVIGNIFDEEVK